MVLNRATHHICGLPLRQTSSPFEREKIRNYSSSKNVYSFLCRIEILAFWHFNGTSFIMIWIWLVLLNMAQRMLSWIKLVKIGLTHKGAFTVWTHWYWHEHINKDLLFGIYCKIYWEAMNVNHDNAHVSFF